MPTKRDFYEVLGVSKSASAADIKAAYRKMALKHHPDQNKEAGAEAKFKEINEAYQVLSDSQKKAAYDQYGHAAFDQGAGGGMGGNPFSGAGQGPFQWSYQSGPGMGGTGAGNPFEGMDFNDPFDIFENIFSGGFGGGQRRQRYSMRIEFMEAVKGVEKVIEIEGKKRTIKIPAGADNGTRIRFDEFDITLEVRPDPTFKRDNYDIYVDQEISYPTAALGGTTEVPTLEGKLKLKVRAGTQSHSLIRLRGEGVQHLQARGKGDLFVRLIVKVPEKLGRDEKRILEELQAVE